MREGEEEGGARKEDLLLLDGRSGAGFLEVRSRLRQLRTGERDATARLTGGSAGAGTGVLLARRLLAAPVGVRRRANPVGWTVSDVVCLVSALVCLGSAAVVVRAGMQAKPLACRAEHEDERP